MIIFHHNDNDGRCAAAIAYRWAMSELDTQAAVEGSRPIITIELDYKALVPVEQIDQKDTVIIVDFSFKPEVMADVRRRTSIGVIWIDHHHTAAGYPYASDPIVGLRDFSDKGRSGCELAWQFFFPHEPMPDVVRLIGDYDTWRLNEQPICFEVYEGVKVAPESLDPKSPYWQALLSGATGVDELAAKGRTCIAYRDSYCSGMAGSYGYPTEIDGYKAYALNVYGFGSRAFGDQVQLYPICIAYVHDGSRFTVSLYSETVDVSVVAKEHGGGGHKGAAGFQCKTLPFALHDLVRILQGE